MTEAEARTKICPKKMLKDERYFSRKCEASECMAWRWKKVANPKYDPTKIYSGIYPPVNPYSQEPASIDSSTDGYCGLAG